MNSNPLPRPVGDTGLGFAYPVGTSAFSPRTLKFWLAELAQLGASWLFLPTTLAETVPEHVLRELASQELELVVGIDVRPIRPIEPATLAAACRHYARAGVHYLYLYDSPNRARGWRYDDWAKSGLVERFADIVFPSLQVIAASGLVPVLSPLAPGGDYWDTSFLSQLLGYLADRKLELSLDHLALAAYLVPDRPLSWGQGGPARWPSARPYARPNGGEDHQSIRLFEWYRAIAVERLGRPLPLIYIDVARPSPLPVSSGEQVGSPTLSWPVAVADALRQDDLPSEVLCVGLGKLASGGAAAEAGDVWYDDNWQPGLLAQQLKARERTPRGSVHPPVREPEQPPAPERDRQDSSEPEREPEIAAAQFPLLTEASPLTDVTQLIGSTPFTEAAPLIGTTPFIDVTPVPAAAPAPLPELTEAAPSANHAIEHYLLLQPADPSASHGTVQTADLIASAADFIEQLRPTVGFRLEEARLARRVTLVGTSPSGLAVVERSLLRAGCLVERVDGATVAELQRKLADLAARDRGTLTPAINAISAT